MEGPASPSPRTPREESTPWVRAQQLLQDVVAAFVLGLTIVIGTVVSAMKILIVPRRSWSLLGSAIAIPITKLFRSS